jgi:lipoate-protein ligase A
MAMFCILAGTNDPYLNLAVEEYLLKNSKDDFLIVGVNSPSVIIGKHQAAHREVDTKFITRNNIPVIRRITGGGTVFHDQGNLNFTFISEVEPGKQVDFRKYTQPVIDFLASAGIESKFEGKNDIRVGGLKISGNAEHVHRNRVLHHGTLLFDSSLDMLRYSIRKDVSCYATRGVNSNPSSVANLKDLAPGVFTDIIDLKNKMMAWFLDYLQASESRDLSANELFEAEKIAASRYKTWEWNYAYGPEYHFQKDFIFEGKEASCRLFVKEGTIRESIAAGDPILEKIARKLIGIRHMPNDVLEIIINERIEMDHFIFF